MVTLHYSLVRRITIAGINEKACYIIWFSVMIVTVGGGQWWFAPFGCAMHLVCVVLTKIDDSFFEIAMRAMKIPEHLE